MTRSPGTMADSSRSAPRSRSSAATSASRTGSGGGPPASASGAGAASVPSVSLNAAASDDHGRARQLAHAPFGAARPAFLHVFALDHALQEHDALEQGFGTRGTP